MAKWSSSGFMDRGLACLAASCTQMWGCSGAVTTITDASAGRLFKQTMSATDFTLSDSGSARKVTVIQASGITVSATGSCNHIFLASAVDGSGLYATTCTGQQLTSGNTVDTNAWDIAIAQPT